MELRRKPPSRAKQRWMWRLGALLLAGLLLAGCEDTKVEQNPLVAAKQGSPLSPLTISLPYDGTVGAGSSYYKVTGLVISSPNTIDLTGFSSDLDLRVGNDPTFSLPPVCQSTNPGTTPESCVATADGSGWLFAQVVNVGGGVVNFTLSTPGGGGLGAPTGLTPTPGNGQIALAWNDVAGAISYNVYFGAAPGVTTASSLAGSPASTTFGHTALTNGTPYYYIVTAFDGVTESPPSNEVSATPSLPAPTGLTPAAGDKQVGLSWGAVAGATGYKVYFATAPGVSTASSLAGSPAITTFTHTGRTNGTPYYYVVTATDTGESPISGEVSATPSLPAPTGLSAAPGNTQVTLTWNPVAGAAGYNLYWDNAPGVTQGTGAPIVGVASPFLHSGRANGTPHYYVVTAVDSGESADSAQANTTPATGSISLPLPGPVPGTVFPTRPDPYEGVPNDNGAADARAILVGDPPQARTLFPAGDEDWVRVNLAASTTYEFSANNLSIRGDTMLELYDAGLAFLNSNDDYIGLDSRVLYSSGGTPETVYLRVLLSPLAIPPEDLPVITYSISARVFSDGDTDGFSPFYDCNDTNLAIYPYAPETAGDAIDQDCDQTDDLLPATADSIDSVFPGDDTVGDATFMGMATGSIYEIQLRPNIFVINARTLHLSTDVDWLVVNAPAFSQYQITTVYDGVPSGLILDWIDTDGTTVLGTNPGALPAMTVTNLNPVLTTYYLLFQSVDGLSTGYYVFATENLGVDADGDGYHTRGGGLGWDCDDTNVGIFPGAPGEAASDGIDTNCNGLDNS